MVIHLHRTTDSIGAVYIHEVPVPVPYRCNTTVITGIAVMAEENSQLHLFLDTGTTDVFLTLIFEC